MNIILVTCTIKKNLCVKTSKIFFIREPEHSLHIDTISQGTKNISVHTDIFICKVQSIHPHPVTSLTCLSNSCMFSEQHNFIATQVPSARSSAKESCLLSIHKHSTACSIAARLSALIDMMVSINDSRKSSHI